MRVLVTGAAGFIGFHTAKRFLERGDDVVALDVVNDYYDVRLKEARIAELGKSAAATTGQLTVLREDVADAPFMESLFAEGSFDRVVHLAAQAGVRYSLEAPHAYVNANVVGFLNILEGCRHAGVAHLVYASTSSVYGGNAAMPFDEAHGVDHPLQLYAATKRANELMAHSYSHLFGLPTTGLRFFTVYGPWGRPDMAPMRFAEAILAGRPIALYNHGNHSRDFTYVDDVVEAVVRVADRPATPDPDFDPLRPEPHVSRAPFRIFNVGHGSPVGLGAFVDALEAALGRPAVREYLPMQPGDVIDTSANVGRLESLTRFQPATPVQEGVDRFAEWYIDRYARE